MNAPTIATILLLTNMVAACDAATHVAGQDLRGQVIDADSGAQMQGAIVYAVWRAQVVPKSFMGHFSMQVCYHAETVTTDSRGRFVLPPWRDEIEFEIENSQVEIRAYKLGYRVVAAGPVGTPAQPGITIPLATVRDTDEERLQEIRNHVQYCPEAGASRKNLFPLLKALYYDARSLPGAAAQPQQIEQLRDAAAEAGMEKRADDTVEGRHARKQRFIQEYLQ